MRQIRDTADVVRMNEIGQHNAALQGLLAFHKRQAETLEARVTQLEQRSSPSPSPAGEPHLGASPTDRVAPADLEETEAGLDI